MPEEREKSIGALWLKQGAKGKYMSGEVTIGDVKTRVVVFKNDRKEEGDKYPDYRIFRQKSKEELARDRGEEEGEGEPF